MQLNKNTFTYTPKQETIHKWQPDIELTQIRPPQASLTTPQWEHFRYDQQILQHIYLSHPEYQDATYTIQFNPITRKPQGIAGIPHIIHLMETRIKAHLLADKIGRAHV